MSGPTVSTLTRQDRLGGATSRTTSRPLERRLHTTKRPKVKESAQQSENPDENLTYAA